MSYSMAKLKRNPDLVKQHCVVTPDQKLVTKKECRILFPETWVGRELAWIEGNIRILTKYMLMIDGDYTVINDCAYMPLTPDSIFSNDIDGVTHYELVFFAGSVVCPNLNLVVNDNILYYIADEFLTKTRKPPYFEYSDMAKLFLNSQWHTKLKLANNNTILELWTATLARWSQDEMIQYRYKANTIQDSLVDKPSYISFKSPVYMANATLSKVSGAYWRDGLMSAITTESHVIEPLEALVRA